MKIKNSYSRKVIIGVALSTMLLAGCKEKKVPSRDTSILQDVSTLPLLIPRIFMRSFSIYNDEQ